MSDSLHVGMRKGLFTFRRKSSGWEVDRVDFLGHPVTMLLEDHRNGALYACLTLGHFGSKLHRSNDGGRNWEELAVPVYPEGAVIAAPALDESQPPTSKPASLTEVWALETAGDDQPDCLWAGTIPGGLFRSSDGGKTWALNESLWQREERVDWFGGGKDEPGIHSICVDPRNSRHVTLGVSCGGVWKTEDAGDSWDLIGEGLRAEFVPPDAQFKKSIQDAHRLAQCNAHPDVMWVQHHNGVFHSTDGSKTFRDIENAGPSTFGFAVCAHPHDEKTAWFVPAVKDECRVPVDGRLVVTRTRDGGKSFETLASGLPQEHCYDIVFRHGLDLDDTGRQLAMGSSTGGLWISENDGD
ncbi:MAG TPA: exo-alpha-sialidase, partial [Planctomycetes bacterium]|nr:exo-alpha-sialidase [Planctomycetota bacterium]